MYYKSTTFSAISLSLSLSLSQTPALPAYKDENLLLSDAIEAPPSSASLRLSPAVPTREDARLSAVLSTASGFVLEALEKRSMKLATSLLTQMVTSQWRERERETLCTVHKALSS